jgi:hypothetical protein
MLMRVFHKFEIGGTNLMPLFAFARNSQRIATAFP